MYAKHSKQDCSKLCTNTIVAGFKHMHMCLLQNQQESMYLNHRYGYNICIKLTTPMHNYGWVRVVKNVPSLHAHGVTIEKALQTQSKRSTRASV